MILRNQFVGRRGWVFTKRYYVFDWRVPHFIFRWPWPLAAHKTFSSHLSYLHALMRPDLRSHELPRNSGEVAGVDGLTTLVGGDDRPAQT